ncbi:hypothetical protein CMQ_4816 [Grosmannia clavigera kw1407]|uniref:Uncharacterized protein n=1 Tax=Grosmannia clavigera (strain kw1407 / UAMH 11150) TaxID=655863 RepID=F0XU58_GROCL|nr:uncharacterized protein CMQ_4816 [Grosmannia clavigera kw1407]EFW98964.1 hypothetical protein CMQ_4816 [Grosmannia clavigera kw1407]
MNAITLETLFSQPEVELMNVIKDVYKEEIHRLTRAYAIWTEKSPLGQPSSPSQLLCEDKVTQYDEVNRTVVSVLALRWIFNGKYEQFVSGQPEAVKLRKASFEWLRKVVINTLQTDDDVQTLVTSIMINDLGKDNLFAEDYNNLTTQTMSTNHDMILLQVAKAVDKAARTKDGEASEKDKAVIALIPSFGKLNGTQRNQILQGLRLGSFFNFGQLAQAENAPASLQAVRDMEPKLDETSFQLHVVEQLLDVAGAAGHVYWTSARKLIEPILEAYRTVNEVVIDVMSRKLSPRQGYDSILKRREGRLRGLGFRPLSVYIPSERALLRILCMGGVADLNMAELYYRVWNVVGEDKKLVKALNIDGSIDEPAVQPTYMPALLAQAISSCRNDTAATEMALTSVLRFLACVMCLSPAEVKNACPVMERNVLEMVWLVQESVFPDNPEILKRKKMPIATPALPTCSLIGN